MHYPAHFLLLCMMLVFAVYGDLRNHRISNRLTLVGLIVGLGLQSVEGGLQDLTSGLLGAAIGLACFAPFYFLRAMGAGDLKLVGRWWVPFSALGGHFTRPPYFNCSPEDSARLVMCCGAPCVPR